MGYEEKQIHNFFQCLFIYFERMCVYEQGRVRGERESQAGSVLSVQSSLQILSPSPSAPPWHALSLKNK